MMKYVLLGLLIASPAFAIDLSIDQTAPILMPDGKTPVTNCVKIDVNNPRKCAETINETVGSVIQDVLTTSLVDPSGRSPDPSNTKAGLAAFQLYGKATVTLTKDQYDLIIARMERVIMSPVTIARMHQFLEPMTGEETTKNEK